MTTPEASNETTNPALTTFGEQLRTLGKNASRNAPTIQELADSGLVGRSTAYAVLSGKRLPSIETLRVLVTAWGGDLQWWLHQRQLIAQARPKTGRAREARRARHPADVSAQASQTDTIEPDTVWELADLRQRVEELERRLDAFVRRQREWCGAAACR